MNAKRVVILILVLSLLALGAKSSAIKSAYGKGVYKEIDVDSGDLYTFIYSFSAKEYIDGSASGYAKESLTLESRDKEKSILYNFEVDIDCLNIFNNEYGTVAAVSGWITSDDEYIIITYLLWSDGDGSHNGFWHSSDPKTYNCMNPPSYMWYMPANVHIKAPE